MRKSTAAIAALVMAMGCGDDGDTTFSSGIAAERPLTSLSDAEARDLCIAVGNEANDVFRSIDVCTFLGLVFSEGDVASCNETANACRMGETPADPFELDDPVVECMNTSAAEVAGCDATVAEFEACVNEALGQLEAFAAAVSCANAATDVGLPDEPFTGAACRALGDECLMIVEDDMPVAPPMP
ncbi:MAG: hypothetical protein AAGH15_03540 [Myxococcota bacterium]